MHPIKKLAAGAATAIALLTGALTVGASPAAAAEYQPDFWSDRCEYGRACIFPTYASGVWNAPNCGETYLPAQSFYYAQSAANPFTVFYRDGRSDYVAGYTSRPLDYRNLVIKVVVWC